MTDLQNRIPVAVLGATGLVGHRFIELLQRYPWFELVALAASEQHAGRSYAEVAQWRLPGGDMPASRRPLQRSQGRGPLLLESSVTGEYGE
jgi:aspartate-semialdehyde dehydrogenase